MALVLIVDDARDARQVLGRLLTREGHATIVAGTGDEALRIIREHKPDLLLLDMLMPGMDGLHLLENLAVDGQRLSPPVVVVTGVKDEQVRRRAESLGVSGYFTKGEYEPAALLNCIGDLAH